MSEQPSTSEPTYTPTLTPMHQVTPQLLDALTRFMDQQKSINEDIQNKQEQIFAFLENSAGASTVAAAAEEVEEEKERQQQRHTVLNSRNSVYMVNSGGGEQLLHNLSPLAPPPVRVRTREEQLRRASHGMPLPFATPAPASTTQNSSHAALTSTPGGQAIDKSRNSPYGRADQALSRLDKFYGDKKHDKDIDIYTFVRAVDFHLERWMPGQMTGRLELAISCTSGPAQMWLLNKKDDLSILVARGQIKAEMAEWDEIKDEFTERMGGGQTQRLYQSRLDDLRMGKKEGSDEVMKFITTFREYALRAYPLDKHPDTRARSLMLGKIFQQRVCDSDFYVWKEAMRMMPGPETLEEWEVALSSAWTTEQAVREQQKRRSQYGDNTGKTVKGKGGSSHQSTSQSAYRMQAEGESETERQGEEDTESGEGQSLNAVAAKGTGNARNSDKKSRPNNKHIDGKIAAQLIRLNRCLHCYKSGHFARECSAPANRPPAENELKA
jgi:hypothetical protein